MDRGAHVNAAARDQSTPLALAVRRSHVDLGLTLLEDPAVDVNVRDSSSMSLLHLVAQAAEENVQLGKETGRLKDWETGKETETEAAVSSSTRSTHHTMHEHQPMTVWDINFVTSSSERLIFD